MTAASMAHRAGHELLAVTMVGMTGTVVSPMSWGHHWVWLVPLLVIGVHMVLQSRRLFSMLLSVAAVAGLVLSSFVWRTYRGHPVTQIDRILPEAYYTGLFHKFGITELRWFTYDPYNWVFVVAAVATVIWLIMQRPVAARTAAEAG
jgi:alpha-1,2-mannosyltransferase